MHVTATRVQMTATPMYRRFMGILSSVHFQSTGLLLICTPILHGINMCGCGPDIMSDFLMDPVTSVRWENPVALGNPVLRAIPETSEFRVTSTQS